jgi:hypothetical protein
LIAKPTGDEERDERDHKNEDQIKHGHARVSASRYARLVFERCARNKRQASRLLNISYHTLDAYLRYGTVRSRPAGKRVPAWAREPCEPTA